MFGNHRRPEALLLPYATSRLLLEAAEDVVTAERLSERLAEDTGDRTTLADAAAMLGVDLDNL